MHYPQLDPVIIELGPLPLRWYGLMYVLAFAALYLLGIKRAARAGFTRDHVSDIVFFGVVGVVLGKRSAALQGVWLGRL